jgi:hypothetical protein
MSKRNNKKVKKNHNVKEELEENKKKENKSNTTKKKSRRRHFDNESDIEMHAGALASIILPVVITFACITAVIKSIGTNNDDLMKLLFPSKPMFKFFFF